MGSVLSPNLLQPPHLSYERADDPIDRSQLEGTYEREAGGQGRVFRLSGLGSSSGLVVIRYRRLITLILRPVSLKPWQASAPKESGRYLLRHFCALWRGLRGFKRSDVVQYLMPVPVNAEAHVGHWLAITLDRRDSTRCPRFHCAHVIVIIWRKGQGRTLDAFARVPALYHSIKSTLQAYIAPGTQRRHY